MNQLIEKTIKNILESKNSLEIDKLINKKILKITENKENKTADIKFLKELQSNLLKIDAINVSSGAWANIKKAKLYLNTLKINSDNL